MPRRREKKAGRGKSVRFERLGGEARPFGARRLHLRQRQLAYVKGDQMLLPTSPAAAARANPLRRRNDALALKMVCPDP